MLHSAWGDVWFAGGRTGSDPALYAVDGLADFSALRKGEKRHCMELRAAFRQKCSRGIEEGRLGVY